MIPFLGIQQEFVLNEQEILAFLNSGDLRRATGKTEMNEHSSRSHAIFRLTIESRDKDEMGRIMTSQLNLGEI